MLSRQLSHGIHPFCKYGQNRIKDSRTRLLSTNGVTRTVPRAFISKGIEFHRHSRNMSLHVHEGPWKEPKLPVPIIINSDSLQVRPNSRNPDVTHTVPPIWLRDHCRCNKCFHPSTKQRLIETFDEIPSDIGIVEGSVVEKDNGVQVTFTDGHQSFFAKDWLEARLAPKRNFGARQGVVEPTLWNGENIRNTPPTVEYDAVMASDDGVKEWLYLVRKFGFCYVNNCPITPEATEKLLERIAFIRTTHYGGFYDFTADLSKGDTAYTQLGIGPHTDNTYFTDPAGLQLFHMLSHTDGEGGVSQLVDGFAAAKLLLEEDDAAYEILSKVLVHSHASGNADSSIQPMQSYPALVHDRHNRHLLQVRWNTTDRASIDISTRSMQDWYDAARKWTQILKRIEYWEPLKPGKALIFDNWRVLHGRSAFTGKRRMCGGYINRDDFISRFKMTNWGRDEVLRQVE